VSAHKTIARIVGVLFIVASAQQAEVPIQGTAFTRTRESV
jgi:hypothetical protein